MTPPAAPGVAPPFGLAPTRTSEPAVWSLVLSIVSFFMCLGPLAAVPAIILGFVAHRQVARSAGRLSGGAFGTAGITIGLFNLLACGGLMAALILAPSTPAPPPYVAPLSPPVVAPPPGVPGAPGGEDGQMTTMQGVAETRVGRMVIVDVPPSMKSLPFELEAQRVKAAAAKERLVLFTVTESCRPCFSVAAVLGDPKMQLALERTRLVRVDVHDWEGELRDLGIQTQKIPGFFLLGADLAPMDGINGGEWDDDTPDNAGPVLRAFVRGTYAKRKEPFVALPRRPSRTKDLSPRSPPMML